MSDFYDVNRLTGEKVSECVYVRCLTDTKDWIVKDYLFDDALQSGAIWISGTRPESIQAQVMHFDKTKGLVYCIQRINYGYNDIAPDTYDLYDFLENFIFMGVKI